MITHEVGMEDLFQWLEDPPPPHPLTGVVLKYDAGRVTFSGAL